MLFYNFDGVGDFFEGARGNKPYDLERMLRIYLVQNLYNLSDMATVAEVIDSRAFSDFCGVESINQVPDGDTLGHFRNILLRNGIQQELFTQVVELLMQRGLILKRGTIVDSTFIEAPSSTKNEKKERDPQAHSAKKGNTWHFGYKAHVDVDLAANFTDEVAAQINGILHDIQTGESTKPNLQEQLEQTQQEFDRLLEMSLDFDENTPFLDDKLKKLNNKIKSLKKAIEDSAARQEKARQPEMLLSAKDLQIQEYDDALTARIIEKITVRSRNEIEIRFIGGYKKTMQLT